jgi:chromosome segregation ATPase
MLFNPTPMERLATLTDELIQKHSAAAAELNTLHEEMASCQTNAKSKEEEIELFTEELSKKEEEIGRLKSELAAKDAEIEAIVAKIESLLS